MPPNVPWRVASVAIVRTVARCALLGNLAGCPAEAPSPCEALGDRVGAVRIGVPATEDLAFDAFGRLVGSDFHTLVWSERDGRVAATVTGIETPAGLTFLPDGDLLVAAVVDGAVLRVTPDGARTTVAGGLNWPNGLALLPDGDVVVSELAGGRVLRVDPDGGEPVLLAALERPNGVVVDGDAVLVGTMTGEGRIWRVPLDGGEPALAVDGLGAGHVDGLELDGCGRLYAADYEGHRVVRIDGDDVVTLLEDPSRYFPGLRFGSGIGGWRTDRLYVSEPGGPSVWELSFGPAR